MSASKTAYRVSFEGPGQIHWEPINELASKAGGAVIELAPHLGALVVGLQMMQLSQGFQQRKALGQLRRDVGAISTKIDLQFLERSLQFFLKEHEKARGFKKDVLNALRLDARQALEGLMKSESSVIPRYLDLQIRSLSAPLEGWSEMLSALVLQGSSQAEEATDYRRLIDQASNWSIDGLLTDQSVSQEKLIQFYLKNHSTKAIKKSSRPLLNRLTEVGSSSGISSASGSDLLHRAMTAQHLERLGALVVLVRQLEFALHLQQKFESYLELNAPRQQLILMPSQRMMSDPYLHDGLKNKSIWQRIRSWAS